MRISTHNKFINFKRIFLFAALYACILFSLSKSYSQSFEGNFLIENYSDKDYDGSSQIWSFTSNNRGGVLIGTGNTIFINSWPKWNNIEVKGAAAVRSLSKDKDGTIYVGIQNNFGMLVSAPKAKLEFKSLLPEGKKCEDIWKTHYIKETNEIVFQSFSALYFYKDGKTDILEVEPSSLLFSHYVNGKLLVQHRKLGLMEVKNHQLVYLKGSGQINNFKIAAILPFENNYLICTNSNGLWLSNLSFEVIKKDTVFAKPFDINFDLSSSGVYQGLQLKDGNYLLGTKLNGAYIFSKKGELVWHHNSESGLPSNQVLSCFEDNYGNIWLGLDQGISKIEYNTGLRKLTDESIEEGIIQSAEFLNEKLFVATNNGLFEFRDREGVRKSYFKRITKTNDAAWKLVKINDATLIAATSSGILKITSAEKIDAKKLIEGDVRSLLVSKKNKGVVYFAGIGWISKFVYSDNNVKEIEIPVEIPGEIKYMEEDENGDLWLTIQGSPLLHLIQPNSGNPQLASYNESKGLIDLTSNIAFNYNKQLYILSGKGILKFDQGKKLFALTNDFFDQKKYPGIQVWRIIPDNKNGFYAKLFEDKNFDVDKNFDDFAYINSNKSINPNILRRLPHPNIHTLLFNKDASKIFFGGDDGMYEFDITVKHPSTNEFNATIIGLEAPKDSIIYNGFAPKDFSITLPYSSNTINADFGALYCGGRITSGKKTSSQYSYKLEGYDTSWSKWSSESDKEYTNLSPGNYIFKVRAINDFGVLSKEDSLEITILPPWYRTWWAYTLYFILFLLLIYVIVQLSIRRLKEAKIRLEHIVTERTAEVVKQKDEILTQKEELEHQKKEITDSIQYAKKIQEAILVDRSIIKQAIPESLVLYIPRDIVSGDFYWYNQLEDANAEHPILIASADCTGHGVPGAFMSMIGSTLLNEIVNEKKIVSPDLILNQLHVEIRRSLKQDEEGSQSRDGMDVALCAINPKTKSLVYSGAMRPLWIINKEGKLTEIKATKNPIGGSQTEDRRIFEKHVFTFEEGDCVYFFSDGYADQFGGAEGKKYTTKRFKDFLISIREKSMDEQLILIEKSYKDWLGHYEQIDDVLVIGVKF